MRGDGLDTRRAVLLPVAGTSPFVLPDFSGPRLTTTPALGRNRHAA